MPSVFPPTSNFFFFFYVEYNFPSILPPVLLPRFLHVFKPTPHVQLCKPIRVNSPLFYSHTSYVDYHSLNKNVLSIYSNTHNLSPVQVPFPNALATPRIAIRLVKTEPLQPLMDWPGQQLHPMIHLHHPLLRRSTEDIRALQNDPNP